jgi:hypothetical protein
VAWLAQLGPRTGYAANMLGPTILAGIGVGIGLAFGVVPRDAGAASAAVTAGQNLGAAELSRYSLPQCVQDESDGVGGTMQSIGVSSP